MTASSEKPGRPGTPAFVHLGDRLLAIERVEAGLMSAAQVARSLGVTADQIREWQLIYAGDRRVELDEFRARGAVGEKGRLGQRARRLATLVASTERLLRDVHVELVREVGGPAPAARMPRRASK